VEVDEILAAAVAAIHARGIEIGGLLQHFGGRLPNGKRSMWLEDIGTGTTIRLDQPRGPGADGCLLDPNALAEGAHLLRRATAAGPDVLVVSRFGNAEADGRGMREELAEAICSGAAVLVAVRYALLNDFEGFLGGPAHLLLPSPEAIADWAQDAALRRVAPSVRD
jgi:hypothetical protein